MHSILVISVPPKGCYHDAPPSFNLATPPFNFKARAEKHCYITLIEHCCPNIMSY